MLDPNFNESTCNVIIVYITCNGIWAGGSNLIFSRFIKDPNYILMSKYLPACHEAKEKVLFTCDYLLSCY